MENNYTTNLTTEERARELKMPVETSMAYLENNWDKVIPYGDLLIVAGYAGEMSGNNVFVAVYQVLDYETVVMEKISHNYLRTRVMQLDGHLRTPTDKN